MTKDVFYLPNFFADGQPTDVFVHFYTAGEAAIKSRIVYNQDMIGFLQQGVKEVFTSKEHAKIDKTQIVLLGSGSALMSQVLSGKNNFESILMFFSNRFLSGFATKYAVEIAKSGTVNNLYLLPKDAFLQNFESSLSLLKDMDSAGIQQLKAEELLLYLLHQYPEQTRSFLHRSLATTVVSKVRQVVNDNIDKGLSIEELAFLCSMSISTFKRHFTETFGTSPKKYFTDFRMAKAKQLLQMNLRASDIYAEIGYESLSSFSNEFKKQFGVSPKQFQAEPKAKVSGPVAQ